jgi:hypothetical protein
MGRQSAIMRCGQPLVGLNRRRCFEDEKLFSAVVRQGAADTVPVVVDARTRAAASAAQNRGGGLEPPERYGQCKVLFARLEAGNTLQGYLERLLEGARQRDRTMTAWLADAAGWVGQVHLCLVYVPEGPINRSTHWGEAACGCACKPKEAGA